jgi:hypothetical protein
MKNARQARAEPGGDAGRRRAFGDEGRDGFRASGAGALPDETTGQDDRAQCDGRVRLR